MNVPPKTLKLQVRNRDRISNGSNSKQSVADKQTIARAAESQSAIEKTPESLPVLEAFQEFLDVERRRTRKRMLILTASFLVMLFAVVGGGFFVGKTFFGQMEEDFKDMQENVKVFKNESLKVRNDTRSVLTQLTGETKRIGDMSAEDHETLAVTGSEIKANASRLATMVDIVNTLELEKNSLREDLDAMKAVWPALSGRVETILMKIAKLRLWNPGPATDTDTIVMSIVPRGRNRAVAWRVPIPE